MPTKISWTEETWNPIVGCSYASEGCRGCYAAREAATRLAHTRQYGGLAVVNDDGFAEFTGEVRFLPERLDQPVRWTKPRRVFVNSMSDLFHPSVKLDDFALIWDTMVRCARHQFQVLTKRPQAMARWLGPRGTGFYAVEEPVPWPQPNIWLGTSIELDKFSFRARHVVEMPNAVPWISAEPLLGPLPSLDLTGVTWLVVGAESGVKARPMDLGWARELRDHCADAGTAFFVKQITNPANSYRPIKDVEHFPDDLQIQDYPA